MAYEKQTWANGDVITANKLNHIENGIDAIVEMELDDTLSVTGKAADAKTVGDMLETKAEIDGAYEGMTVGNAEQLVSTVFEEDKTPYVFRTAGGSIDIGDREEDTIIGGSIAWNQLYEDGNFEDSTKWKVQNAGSSLNISDNIATVTWNSGILSPYNPAINTQSRINVLTNHKYYIHFEVMPVHDCRLYVSEIRLHAWKANVDAEAFANTWNVYEGVYNAENDGDATSYIGISNYNNYGGYVVGESISYRKFQLFDLTQMFGSAVADMIYNLETGTAGAGVAFFKKLFPKPYYAYDAGTLMHVSGLVSHDLIGFNAYDTESGKAKVVGNQQYQITGTYTALSLDGNTVTPDASGYFTPDASGELSVTGGADDTCVHLVWDGERDGEYEEYVKHSYPLDDSLTLRGIPKLDANDNLYFDGDTYESDGTVTRKYGIRAYQSGDATDGSTMITDGTNTVYALSTPTEEQAEPYTNPQIVDDFGTEEYVISTEADVIVPVGHVTQYAANLRAKVEMMPDSPDGDGDYLVRQANGENTYVQYTDGGRITALEAKIPAAPTTDGTYKLTVTVTSGTPVFTWENE